MWDQMKEIAMFTGPAAGLWLCGPLMSLIDTAVIGQSSSLELAALGNSILSFFFSGFICMVNYVFIFVILTIISFIRENILSKYPVWKNG